jgi:DNA-binding NtrC family response regulator
MTAVGAVGYPQQLTILLVGSPSSEAAAFADEAAHIGWRAIFCTDLSHANAILDSSSRLRVSAVVLDEDVDPAGACEAVADLRRRDRCLAVVVVASSSSSRCWVDALRAGASDCVAKPVVAEQLLQVLRRVTHRVSENAREQEPCADSFECGIGFDSLIEADPSFRAAWAQVVAGAQRQGHVLVEGEPGTGKDLLARAIHAASPRANSPLKAIDVRGTGPAVIESLLFGHARGAFVGAFETRQGLLEECDGATLMLDQVDQLPAPIQERLAEALLHRHARRLGAAQMYPLDVRLIALATAPLAGLVASRAFSARLYELLAGTRIYLPSLRERPGDVAIIAREFVQSFRDPTGLSRLAIDEAALSRLARCDWPGNSRQLAGVLLRAIGAATTNVLTAEDFARMPASACNPRATSSGTALFDVNLFDDGGHVRSLLEIENEVIRLAHRLYEGRMSEIALRLGIGRSTLYRKVAELGIECPRR